MLTAHSTWPKKWCRKNGYNAIYLGTWFTLKFLWDEKRNLYIYIYTYIYTNTHITNYAYFYLIITSQGFLFLFLFFCLFHHYFQLWPVTCAECLVEWQIGRAVEDKRRKHCANNSMPFILILSIYIHTYIYMCVCVCVCMYL